jgi:sialate O-acetylesterase
MPSILQVFRPLLLGSLFLFLNSPLQAKLKLPQLFSDHAVLQRDVVVPVWGWAEPGEKITLRMAGQTLKTVADKQGAWRLNLAPHPAGGPFDLTLVGKDTLVVHDLLFGEVWLCA